MKGDKDEYWNFSLCTILQRLSCSTNRLLKVHMMYDVTILQSLLGHHFFGFMAGQQTATVFGENILKYGVWLQFEENCDIRA